MHFKALNVPHLIMEGQTSSTHSCVRPVLASFCWIYAPSLPAGASSWPHGSVLFNVLILTYSFNKCSLLYDLWHFSSFSGILAPILKWSSNFIHLFNTRFKYFTSFLNLRQNSLSTKSKMAFPRKIWTISAFGLNYLEFCLRAEIVL